MCRLKSEQLWTFMAKESWLEDALASALGAWMSLSPEMGCTVCPSVISQDCVVKIEAASLRRWGFGCRQADSRLCRDSCGEEIREHSV